MVIVEDRGMPNGWPLGLGNLNARIRVRENLQPAAAEEPSLSFHPRSSSFSSLSSSNLDTESTASFFQDHSTSLGRLIGIRPRDRGGVLYFSNTNRVEPHDEGVSERRRSCSNVPRGRQEEMSQGICAPLFFSILEKMSRSRSTTGR